MEKSPAMEHAERSEKWTERGILAAIVAAQITCGITTTLGFLQIPLEQGKIVVAITATIAVQALLLSLALYARRRSFFRRVFLSVIYVGVALVSVSFSFVAWNGAFRSQVARKRLPIIERGEFERSRRELDAAAQRIRGVAINHLTTALSSKRRALAEAQVDVEQVTQEADTSPFGRWLRDSSGQDAKRNLRALQTDIETVSNQIQVTQAYKPAIAQVAVGDDINLAYANLQGARDGLAEVWAVLPPALMTAYPLPPAPAHRTLGDTGIREGQDHSFVEAFSRLRAPEPGDRWTIGLAAFFDLVPLVLLWAIRPAVPLHEWLRERRRSMARTTDELNRMPGVLRWSAKSAGSFLVGRDREPVDPRVHYLREVVLEAQESIEGVATKGGVNPQLYGVVHDQLMALGTDLEFASAHSSAKTRRLVLDAHEECLRAIDKEHADDPHARTEAESELSRLFLALGLRVAEAPQTPKILATQPQDTA